MPELFHASGAGAAGTETIIVWEGGLSVVLLPACLSCRGWRTWRQPHHQDADFRFR